MVLHQSLVAAEVFHRDEDGEWSYDFLSAEGVLEMSEVGVSLPLGEIYADVELAR